MGSQSDLPAMMPAATVLEELQIPFEIRVLSAHRTPDLTFAYAHEAAGRGLAVIIAGAGASAALPGVLAAKTWLPIIGVPLNATALNGIDALLAIAQMPGGVPVATVAIGQAGAKNAGLLAARILAVGNAEVRKTLTHWIGQQTAKTASVQIDLSSANSL